MLTLSTQLADNSRAVRKKSTTNQYGMYLRRHVSYWLIVLFFLASRLLSAICFSVTRSLLSWFDDFCFSLSSVLSSKVRYIQHVGKTTRASIAVCLVTSPWSPLTCPPPCMRASWQSACRNVLYDGVHMLVSRHRTGSVMRVFV